MKTIFVIITFALIYGISYYMMRLITNIKNREEIIIKVFQEIACDYHVRIIDNGYGNILCENEEWLTCKSSTNPTSGCMEFGTENQERWIRGFEYSDKGKFYIIYFRLLGKCYLAYSNDNLSTWMHVVRTARKENKRFFSKSNIYDRNKI